MRNRVDWSDPRLGSGVYEDLVSVLLSRLHPSAQRIDGSGGDGGRDVQLPLASGLEIFELKSFTGRLSNEQGRRAQVKRSLKRAAAHNPVAWHLVVPIDHTDSELKWFNQLAADYSFSCDWLGKTWLDEKISTHSDIPRYFLEGSAEEIVELMREISQEQASLGRGVPDAIDRIRGLTGRLNALDPHYFFGFSSQPDGSVTISMLPRYKGAERDRPIQIGGLFQFPDTEHGREIAQKLEDTIYYGSPSSVPGEFVKRLDVDAPAGMGGSFEGGDLRFNLPDSAFTKSIQIVLRILNKDGEVCAQTTLLSKTHTVGQRGGEIMLADIGGALNVTARIDLSTSMIRLKYQYSTPSNALPSSLLPALRLLSEMTPGRFMTILFEGREAGPPMQLKNPVDEHLIGFRKLVEDLDKIQHLSGVYFPMPATFGGEDLEKIAEAYRLLSGETLTGEWSRLAITTSAEALQSPAAQEFLSGEVRNLFTEYPLDLQLDGLEYPLGRARKTYATARIEVEPHVPDNASLDTEIDLVFVPGPDRSMSVTLVPMKTVSPEPE